jgi:hypothetical protein
VSGDGTVAGNPKEAPVRRRFRLLAVVPLLAAILWPMPARASLQILTDADGFATDSRFCGAPGNHFTVQSGMTLDVVGEVGQFPTSCHVDLDDGAAVNLQRVSLRSQKAATTLFMVGKGRTRFTIKDSTISVGLQYVTLPTAPTEPAETVLDIQRTRLDGPFAAFILADRARVRLVESESVTPYVAVAVLPTTTTSAGSIVEVLDSTFDAGGGTEIFVVGFAPHFGKLTVKGSRFAPGDNYVHHPNPTP